LIAGRQLNHCVYKMPPETTRQFSSTRAQVMDRVLYFDIILPFL